MSDDSFTTQCYRILHHMKQGHSITGLEALRQFGCIHLPRRILDLRERGHAIESEFVRDPDTGKRFKRYWLQQRKQ